MRVINREGRHLGLNGGGVDGHSARLVSHGYSGRGAVRVKLEDI